MKDEMTDDGADNVDHTIQHLNQRTEESISTQAMMADKPETVKNTTISVSSVATLLRRDVTG
jgi:hypothetical protein